MIRKEEEEIGVFFKYYLNVVLFIICHSLCVELEVACVVMGKLIPPQATAAKNVSKIYLHS